MDILESPAHVLSFWLIGPPINQSLSLGECHMLTEEPLVYLNCDKEVEFYPNHLPTAHTTLGGHFQKH